MKIINYPKKGFAFDTSIYLESNDDLNDLKTMIDTYIYHSVNKEMKTIITVLYIDIKIKIYTKHTGDEITYFNIKSPLIDVIFDKKDLPLKRICKLINKQILLSIKYRKAEVL